MFSRIPLTSPILEVTEAFSRDLNSKRINLGLESLRNELGEPLIFESVKRAQQICGTKYHDYEYPPLEGVRAFLDAGEKFAYGQDMPAVKEKRIAKIQGLSTTGSLRLGTAFLKRFYDGPPVYLPDKTSSIHYNICHDAEIPTKSYRYYDQKNKSLDFNGMIIDLETAPNGSVILLQACSHNPTGLDLNSAQWNELKDLFIYKSHMPFFDMSYQGLASGDIAKDAYGVRLFARSNINLMLSQSFSRILGLYGYRVGLLTVVCDSEEEAQKVLSQVKILMRSMVGLPPLEGARIAEVIINTPDLYKLWLEELKIVHSRLTHLRSQLILKLSDGESNFWNHMSNQTGVFAYSGLERYQIQELKERYHIYLPDDGRISLGALTNQNLSYVADSLSKFDHSRRSQVIRTAYFA